jgi:hypothetical protein
MDGWTRRVPSILSWQLTITDLNDAANSKIESVASGFRLRAKDCGGPP